MIKILIVDDSRAAQEFMTHILSSDPDIKVVGVAGDGTEVLDAVRKWKPDLITMDVHMPRMDGFKATRQIMETIPTPVIIVSGASNSTETSYLFNALDAGALAVVLRPPGSGHPEHHTAVTELIRTVKMMSEIKVIKRFPQMIPYKPFMNDDTEIRLIAIGASTGGPPVLRKILSLLPADLGVPVLIVQHIAKGFTDGFVEWLSSVTHFPLQIGIQGQKLMPGQGYVAPDNIHMGINEGSRILLSDHEPENGLRPSVAYLFRTAARVMGSHAIGVLLTGMGKDGAPELKLMKDAGAITIAQDEASSIVHGMPGEAIRIGAAKYILKPEDIASVLIHSIRRLNGAYE